MNHLLNLAWEIQQPQKYTVTYCQRSMRSWSFFRFMANLEISWIPDAWYIILTFLLIKTFHLIKTESKTKTSITQISYVEILQKNPWCNKIKGSCRYTLYILKLHMCVCLRITFQFFCLILMSFRQGAQEEENLDTLTVKTNQWKGLTRLGLIKFFLSFYSTKPEP